MSSTKIHSRSSVFSDPAVYQIKIQGKVSSALIRAIDHMQICENENRGELLLIGRLPDQSALMGLLITIHELHYGILSTGILVHES